MKALGYYYYMRYLNRSLNSCKFYFVFSSISGGFNSLKLANNDEYTESINLFT